MNTTTGLLLRWSIALLACAGLPSAGFAQEVAWAVRYDGGTLEDVVACAGSCDPLRSRQAFALDPTGDLVVTGSAWNGYHYGFRTVKYSAADGSVLWSVGYGEASLSPARAVVVDASGDVYVTGSSWRTIRTIKLAGKDGRLLWAADGGYEGAPSAIALDGSGNVYVAGSSWNGMTRGLQTIKYSGADGITLWSLFDGNGANEPTYVIAADGAGDVLVAGDWWNGSDHDYRTTKYSGTDGSVLWSKDYDGPAFWSDERVHGMALDGFGNPYVTGSSKDAGVPHYRTLKYASADGAVLWNAADADNGEAHAIGVDASGNAYVTGIVNVNGYNYRTVKYGSLDGSLLWSATYGGALDDRAYAIALDGAGNACVTGSSGNGFQTVKHAAADGAVLWSADYSSGSDLRDEAYAIGVDPTGNVFVVGSTSNSDYRVVKHASNGALVFAVTEGPTSGGSDRPGAGDLVRGKHGLALDGLGNVFVTGESWNGSSLDFRTIKLAAADGSLVWSAAFDGPGQRDDQAYAIAVDASGDVYVTGSSWNGTTYDFRTIRYAGSDGSVLWSVAYNGPTNSYDHAYALALDKEGDVYVTGDSWNGSSYDYRTVKYAGANGRLLWSAGYSGSGGAEDIAYAVAVDAAGDAVVTGSSWRGESGGMQTIKYAGADGSEVWSVGDASADADGRPPSDLALDASGNAYVTTAALSSWQGSRTTKYAAADGRLLWRASHSFGANAIAVDGAGDVYVTGASWNGTTNDFRTAKCSGTDGALLWSVGYDGLRRRSWDEVHAIAMDSSGGVYVAGRSGADLRAVKYSTSDGTSLWTSGIEVPQLGEAYTLAVGRGGTVHVAGYAWGGPTGVDFLAVKYAPGTSVQAAAPGAVSARRPGTGRDRRYE